MNAKKSPRKPLSVVESVILRDQAGLSKYRKSGERDPEKRALLLELGLRRIEKAEQDNFFVLGPRRRRVHI